MAASRVFVHESIAAKFTEQLKARFEQLGQTARTPTDPTAFFGPLADAKQFQRVMGYIESGKVEAELVTGGSRHGDKGYHVEPTIFLNPKDDARIYREEIFGPVTTLRTFKTEDEAVRMANDTSYGLSGACPATVAVAPLTSAACVFTGSTGRALRVCASNRVRHGQHQQLTGHRHRRAVWRVEAERHRARGRPTGPHGLL